MRLKQQTHDSDRASLTDHAKLIVLMAIALVASACTTRTGDTTSQESGVTNAEAAVDAFDAAQSEVAPGAPDRDKGPGVQKDALTPGADAGAADTGATITDDGEVVEADDAKVFDSDSTVSADGQLPDDPDVHVIVAPPSSHQKCNCWPDGDDCDAFWDAVDWVIKDSPPCPEGETCTGDYYNPGTCLASCWHPALPDQNVGVQCHPSEYCFLRKLYDWEHEVMGQYAVCYPKQ